MASSSITSAAIWLGRLVEQEAEHLRGVSDKVGNLRDDLVWTQCFLEDANEKENKEAVVRQWVSEVRNLALEAEDVIQMYILGVSHKWDSANGFWSQLWNDLKWVSSVPCYCTNASALHKVGSEVDALSEKIKMLTSRLQTYGIKTTTYKSVSHLAAADEWRRTLAPAGVSNGREATYSKFDQQRIDYLTLELVQGTHKLVVLHGMGGVGKTTLASNVYQQRHMMNHFAGFAWVYIPQQMQLESICKDILLQILPIEERDEIRTLADPELPRRLSAALKNKKYLIFLDDVWKREEWLILESCFHLSHIDFQGKVLLTTRDSEVVPRLGDGLILQYEVAGLTHELSWELLEREGRFNRRTEEPYKQLGDRMLENCGGLPLAIVVLGRLLGTKKTEEEWGSVYENLPSHFQWDPSHDNAAIVHQVLALSYYELPFAVKPCFLYLGGFPKSFDIPVQKLYHLWIAEGNVSSIQGQGSSVEEVANAYITELVRKSMVEIRSKGFDGKIENCGLHDVMRDMCLKKIEEENYLKVIDHNASEDMKQHVLLDNTYYKTLRRLVVHVGVNATGAIFDPLLKKKPPLRSLIFVPIKGCRWDLTCGTLKSILETFQLLRVLDFEGVPLDNLPSEIGCLIYLRFLSLKGTNVTVFPSSIGHLKSLIILDLRVAAEMVSLPNVLRKLQLLQHLYLPQAESLMNNGRKILDLHGMNNLEILEGVDLGTVDIGGLILVPEKRIRHLSALCSVGRELGSLRSLLKSRHISSLSLEINADIIIEDPTILATCRFLNILHVNGRDDQKSTLPWNPETFPENLVELTIHNAKLEEACGTGYPLLHLEKLPKLKKLHLIGCYDGTKMCSSGFPSLALLIIEHFPWLTEWVVDEGALPKLEKLEIYDCPMIRMIPKHLPAQVSIIYHHCIKGTLAQKRCCSYFSGWESDFETVLGNTNIIRGLTERLVDSNCETLLQIVGRPGTGNTLLAREVCSHKLVKDHFAGIAWVDLPHHSQVGTLCVAILLQLPQSYQEREAFSAPAEVTELLAKLHAKLNENNYLVVFDEVVYPEDWALLTKAFPSTAFPFKSLFLLTTRPCGEPLDTDWRSLPVYSFQVPEIDDEASWELLQKIACFQSNDAASDMTAVGRELAIFCGGNLASIVGVGKVLAVKKTLEEWISVREYVVHHVDPEGSHVLAGLPFILGDKAQERKKERERGDKRRRRRTLSEHMQQDYPECGCFAWSWGRSKGCCHYYCKRT